MAEKQAEHFLLQVALPESLAGKVREVDRPN